MKDTVTEIPVAPSRGHNSPYDRGRADSYYSRPPEPNKRTGHLGVNRITDLTPEETQEYYAGYDWNEQYGEKKDWR
jgi:hypothetical protein